MSLTIGATKACQKQKQPPEVLKKTLATLLKESLWQRCFPVNFAKYFTEHLFYRGPVSLRMLFLRTPIRTPVFKNTSLRTHVGPRTTFLQNTSGDYFYKNQAFPPYFFQLLNMRTS